MSIAFNCACGRSLRANAKLAGKKTKCPGCGKILTIPADGNGEVAAGAPPKGAASAANVVTCACGKKIATKAEWAGKLIKCPGCGEKVKVPGGAAAGPSEAVKPAGATRPPPLKPAAPAKRPVARDEDDDEDEDDKDEEEEEEPAPRKRKKGAKKGGSMVLLLSLGGAATVLLIGLGVWLIFLRGGASTQTAKGGSKKGQEVTNPAPAPAPAPEQPEGQKDAKQTAVEPPPPAPKADGPGIAAHVPADAAAFLIVRYGNFLKSPSGQKLRNVTGQILGPILDKADEESRALFGIGQEDFQEVALVLTSVPDGPNFDVGYALVTTSKPWKAEGFEKFQGPQGQKFTKKEVNGKELYVTSLDIPNAPAKEIAVHLLTPQLAIYGTENAIGNVLGRGEVPKEGPLADAVTAAQGDGSLLFIAGSIPPMLGDLVNMLPPDAEEFKVLAQLTQARLTVHEDKGLRITLSAKYPDADTAGKAKAALDAGILLAKPQVRKGAPPGMQKMVEAALASVKPRVNEDTLQVPLRINATIGDLVEMAMKGAGKVQVAAAAATGLNNLKQLALAMHNYHDAYKALPEAKIGAGLSWRVAVLPFVEQLALQKQFKADEPWDSEHNMKLLAPMPKVFEIPGRPAPPGHTYFRVFTGPKTPFQDGMKTTLTSFKDGNSNTLLIVEAQDPVPWTKPEELEFDGQTAPPLGNQEKAGAFLAAFADGRVVSIRMVEPETLRALITMDGGEPVDLNKLK